MDYGVGDCLAQDLLGNLQQVDTRDTLNSRDATQVFGDSRNGVRDHFAQRSLADCAVYKPQRPRRTLLCPRMNGHIDKELGIELLRVNARGKETRLGHVSLRVEEI